MNTLQISRKFKIGHIIQDDPAPTQSLETVFRILCGMFPVLRHTNGLFEEDATLSADLSCAVYTLPVVPPKTNG